MIVRVGALGVDEGGDSARRWAITDLEGLIGPDIKALGARK
jgi:hypothetical protein